MAQHTNTRAQWDNRQGEERAARSGMGFGDLYTPVGFVNGRLTHDYGEMIADIASQPRPTLWNKFTLALAGQR